MFYLTASLLDKCSLLLRSCTDLVPIDENVPLVYLLGVIIDVFVPLGH